MSALIGGIFGGYTAGQSKDTNYTGTQNQIQYEGWRIWDISEDKQTITLISAGCPEAYQHNLNDYISEYVLTGNINGNAESASSPDYLENNYNIRDWSAYKNEKLYAESVIALQKSELDVWYSKYIDEEVTDTKNLRFESNTSNKLNSMFNIGLDYWLCEAANDAMSGLYRTAHPIGVSSLDMGTLGVRILVTLSSDVEFNEKYETVSHDGFTYNKWAIQEK